MRVESLVEMATRYIEELIVTGELKPGEQIKEDDIAGTLDISRPPVREALNGLEGEGLVVRKPRRGAFVIEMTEKDIWEIYTLKAELYATALNYAMDRITNAQILELKDLVAQMKANAETKEEKILAFQRLHREFHIKIMTIAGNQRLLKMAASLHKQIRRYSFQTLGYDAHLTASNQFHQRIVDLIEQKDREQACKMMRDHVLDAMTFLLSHPDIFNDCAPEPAKKQKINNEP
ncbi:MAG: GntR family transcriptional regulator [Desulfobacter sp.]